MLDCLVNNLLDTGILSPRIHIYARSKREIPGHNPLWQFCDSHETLGRRRCNSNTGNNGADINASSRRYGSVPAQAVWSGRKEIVELLLDNGADINASGGTYGSTLGLSARFSS